MTDPFLTKGPTVFESKSLWVFYFVLLGLMLLSKQVKRGCKTDAGAAVLILPQVYDWVHLLQSPSPTVQSQWMGICWSWRTRRQLSSVFEVKQHPWLGAKSVFKEAVVVVVFQSEPASERRTEGRDSHRCLINVWSSSQTEGVCGAWPALSSSPQRTLSTPRTPLHLFIARRTHTQNTPIISASTSGERGRGGGGGSVKLTKE